MLNNPGDLADDIAIFAGLLAIVLAGPDAGTSTAIDGMHKVVLEIGERAKQLKRVLDDKA